MPRYHPISAQKARLSYGLNAPERMGLHLTPSAFIPEVLLKVKALASRFGGFQPVTTDLLKRKRAAHSFSQRLFLIYPYIISSYFLICKKIFDFFRDFCEFIFDKANLRRELNQYLT